MMFGGMSFEVELMLSLFLINLAVALEEADILDKFENICIKGWVLVN